MSGACLTDNTIEYRGIKLPSVYLVIQPEKVWAQHSYFFTSNRVFRSVITA